MNVAVLTCFGYFYNNLLEVIAGKSSNDLIRNIARFGLKSREGVGARIGITIDPYGKGIC